MSCINSPALSSSFPAIFMYPVVTPMAKSGKKIVSVEQRPMTLGLMMHLSGFIFLATLANRVEGQIGFANICILLVFTLALGGCIPQPSAAFEAIRSF